MSNLPDVTDAIAHIKDHTIHGKSMSGPSAPGSCGDIIYKGASTLEALTADAGDGYNVLISQGSCKPPKWESLVDIITYLTGAVNRIITQYLSVPVPTIQLLGNAVTSDTARTATMTETVPVATIGTAETAVGSGTAKTANATLTVPIPTFTGSAVLV